MKIILLQSGKTKDGNIEELAEQYFKRLRHYINLEVKTLPDLKNTAKLSTGQIKSKEGEYLLKAIENTDYLVLLDENGKELSSLKFAAHLQKLMNRGLHTLVFAIGGPYGFSEEVLLRAQEKLSLSRMTFSHQIIRPIFAEQLYRAFTILKNEPYHHQ